MPFCSHETVSVFLLRNRDLKPEWTRRIKVTGRHFALQMAFNLTIRLGSAVSNVFHCLRYEFDPTLDLFSKKNVFFPLSLSLFSRVKRSLSSCKRTWWRFLMNSIRWGCLSFSPRLLISRWSSILQSFFFSLQLQQSHQSFICSFCHFLLLSHCLHTGSFTGHKCNNFRLPTTRNGSFRRTFINVSFALLWSKILSFAV